MKIVTVYVARHKMSLSAQDFYLSSKDAEKVSLKVFPYPALYDEETGKYFLLQEIQTK